MNVKTITYQKVKNLGNYESERLEMTIELDPSDDAEAAARILMVKVQDLLNPPLAPDDDPEVPW